MLKLVSIQVLTGNILDGRRCLRMLNEGVGPSRNSEAPCD